MVRSKADRACPKCKKVLFTFAASFGTHVKYCQRDYRPVFWSRVEKTEDCWNWKGAIQRDGYGHFKSADKTVSSHRYAYEQMVGPIASGMDLLHSCDNRRCVNPAHLRQGTHGENMLEAKAKRRHAHGVRSHHAKLTEDQVREIRRLWIRTGYRKTNAKELSERFGVTTGTICGIARRYIWEYVE